MRPKLPVMADYEVSPETGFLPSQVPLERLPQDYYAPWETAVANLPALILTHRLREQVHRLPLLATDQLVTLPQWRRAYMVLSFLCHGYVWAGDVKEQESQTAAGTKVTITTTDTLPSDTLPTVLTQPWMAVCEKLELLPVATYAGLCLWNFRTVVECASPAEWTLESLATLNTYTGSIDESWFYLVSTAMERQGGPALKAGLLALQAVRDDDASQVIHQLQIIAQIVDSITTLLGRMYEMCDPHVFYFRMRPYLAGWKNMAEAGLPQGVKYGDEKTFRQYSGGSNAQSSLIQALDILLNVEHHPTGYSSSTTTSSNFIHEMRCYMPGPHRRFLEHLTSVADIRDYVVTNQSQETPNASALVLAYDACVAMMRVFRDKHIQIVTRYIILQAKKNARTTHSATKRDGLAQSSNAETGTGGTALIPFLKQARDETGVVAAGEWGKRLLSETIMMKPLKFDNGDKQ
ncbi:Indoleamine 2,3-dioxygenase [Nadsonia fulvescens var. elongata DSM 6958]|uniref:Indoleamine 2,3-dioxygenase n=1 Tax=Nadsonia fulvescens var. elongata DSM 6958 TaxID=857566 RepID=A0A1E3PGY6_9ASCO|nr:Indoleamine 2,3-dioxygenase [Nadsonia fulvescens var. elongata DSM 6958]